MITFAWELSLANFSLGTLTCELSLEDFRLEIRCLSHEGFRLGAVDYFRVEMLVWKLELGNFRLGTCALELSLEEWCWGNSAWELSIVERCL